MADLPRGVLIPVWTLAVLSIALLWIGILYDQGLRRDEALNRAETQTRSIAIALREHVHGVISSADLMLQRVDDSLARSSGVYVLPEWVAQAQFLGETLIQVGIIGPDGHALATTLPDLGEIDLSDRDHFRVHLDPGEPQPFISRPVVGRGSGKPSIQISRRIEYPDGSFAGVGVVSLDPGYFNRFFESIDLGPRSLIYLVGRDGVLRARSSRAAPDVGIGQDFGGTPIMKTLLSMPQGVYRARSDVDGIERIYAFAADTHYPVIVAAATAVDDVLGVFSSEEVVEFVAAMVLSAIILGLVGRATLELSRCVEQEKQLLKAQKLEAVGQLTAGIAHDFSNILTVIKGNVSRASRSEIDDLRKLLGNIELAAQQGERIVSNLLAFSRQQRLRPESVDVNEVVEAAADLLRAGLGSKWNVRCELAPHLPPVSADRAQVGTALLNLAINARDAMPAGGTVVFGTKLVEVGGPSKPHDLSPGSYVAVSVEDSGIGMPSDVEAKVFDPFFTTKEQGTGLGLSQVSRLAKQLGGTVTIETAEHIGTAVTIYLPVMELRIAPVKVAASVVEPQVTNSGAPSVLVADDNAMVRDLICSTLREAGYNVIEACDGPSALYALDRHLLQLAVLDILMPGMSGIDVFERAREHGWSGAVLFVSGFTDPTNLARIRDQAFLGKPFTAQALRTQIARLVAGTTCASRKALESDGSRNQQ